MVVPWLATKDCLQFIVPVPGSKETRKTSPLSSARTKSSDRTGIGAPKKSAPLRSGALERLTPPHSQSSFPSSAMLQACKTL